MGALNVRLLLLVCLSVGMTDDPSLNGDAGSNKNGGEDNEDEDCPSTSGEFKQNHIIKAVDGTNITLQCFPKFSFKLENANIHWYKDNDTEELLLVKGGKLHNKKDRIMYYPEELKKGNASITLSNVTESDGGNYCCCIELIRENDQNQTCINQTVVVKNEDPQTKGLNQSVPDQPSPSPLHPDTNNYLAIGLGVGIPAVVIAVITALYCFYRKKQKSAVAASSESNPAADPHPQQSNDASDGQEEQNNTMEMNNMINNDNREPETAGRSLESQEKSERDNNTKQGDENSPLMAGKQLDDAYHEASTERNYSGEQED